MEVRDLSVIIAARNEEFLSRTVEGVLSAKRGNTEVIVICDGNWPDPPIKDHPDLKMVYHPRSVGQRAALNEGAKISKAKYIMKLDAHCIVEEGFDVKLIQAAEELGRNVTQVPTLYNLHAFDWKCKKCGNKWYQGPTPTRCLLEDGHTPNEKCDSTEFERIMIWKPRWNRKSDLMRFDRDLHFQYWGGLGKRDGFSGPIAETMSLLGACFFMNREWYWELGGSDEQHGSWGQQGTEIACKSWLSGGRLVVNRNTWYSHLFRTQGGDFGFPYPLSGKDVEKARSHSKDMWKYGKWDKAIHPLSWLVERFWPVPGWEQQDLDELKQLECKKGIVFYTDNRLGLKIAHKVQKQLRSIGLPIVSASLKPMNFGKNVHIREQRGVLTMFKQILAALEASSAEYVFLCEHDVLYHPSHFEFTPPEKDKIYYNTNVWKVDAKTGKALHYDCKQVSGICAYRPLLIEHYRKRVEMVQKNGFTMAMGYEPGTHNRPEKVDDLTSQTWQSNFPNLDIRHDGNLSKTRWNKEEFRNQKNTQGWSESQLDKIPGWNLPIDSFAQ